jgi:hypothetical protein
MHQSKYDNCMCQAKYNCMCQTKYDNCMCQTKYYNMCMCQTKCNNCMCQPNIMETACVKPNSMLNACHILW